MFLISARGSFADELFFQMNNFVCLNNNNSLCQLMETIKTMQHGYD